jgi:ATP-dependent DNA helicase RecQ
MLIRDATSTPLQYLRTAVGREDARFRQGQLACIEAAVRGERLLVVQRTGWGKSAVYFLAREREGAGVRSPVGCQLSSRAATVS